MRHLCWIPDYEDEDNAIEIEAMDAEDAAQDACERWEEKGRWAGDPMPDRIEYSLSFYAYRSAKAIK